MSGTGPLLAGQAVIVIGGSSGIGLETARLAAAEGAAVTITGRDPGRLAEAARDVGARRAAAFDVHLMVNTALTGATYDVDGGQQFTDV